MKKGLILITFAWAVEVVGVVAGFVTAIVTNYPDGNLPTSPWPWLMVLPMGMIAVAELGRIPLTSLLFRRHKVMQVVALVGIVVLAGLAFENWLFGFERIVALQLKPVTAADLVLTKAEAAYNDINNKHANSGRGNKDRREDLKSQLAEIESQIKQENENFNNNMKAISDSCHKVREVCVQPQQDKERARHTKAIDPLEKKANELRQKILELTDSDRAAAQKLEEDIAAASDAVTAAKKTKAEEISQNQIFRLAAMWYRVDPQDVTPKQFEVVRFWFSTFSAVAVSLAGTVAAFVYYAKECPRVRLSPLGKLTHGLRAWVARRRRNIYRDKIVDRVVYREGKHVVLIPWWIWRPSKVDVKDDAVVQLKAVKVG